MEKIDKLISEITSNCTCVDEDGEERLDDCWGWCYQYAEEDTDNTLDEWARRNDYPSDTVRIESKAIGWRQVAGYAVTSLEGVAKVLRLNGDYRIEFIVEGNDLTIKRWSHDEPTGATFTANFIPDETEHTR